MSFENGVVDSSKADFGGPRPLFWSLRASILEPQGASFEGFWTYSGCREYNSDVDDFLMERMATNSIRTTQHPDTWVPELATKIKSIISEKTLTRDQVNN